MDVISMAKKNSKEDFSNVVGKFFPTEAIDFAWTYFQKEDFNFKISPSRVSKKGDFRYFKLKNKRPTITVNGDLCTYDFLLVYLHELAHYFVYKHYQIEKVKAHGKEWKDLFRALLVESTTEIELPQDIRDSFLHHAKKCPGSSALDKELEITLDKYRKKPEGVLYLKDLKAGDIFICRSELFKLESFARTRATCTMLRNNRRYLISGMMNVKTAEL